VDCLAPLAQPTRQSAQPSQLCTARGRALPGCPAAASASRTTRLRGPITDIGVGAVRVPSKMRSNAASSSGPSSQWSPLLRDQSCRTQSGILSMMAEFMTVLPPRQRPCMMGTGDFAWMMRRPPSHMYWLMKPGPSRVMSSGAICGPASSTTVRSPAAAKFRAATAPPAPLPTTMTSAWSSKPPARS
jgi:hypothetical protein